MKQKSFSFIICFLIAIVLLSLPVKTNAYLQNVLSENSLFFSHLTSTDDEAPSDHSQIQQWLEENQLQKEQVDSVAKKVLPDDVTYIIGKVLYRTQNSWNSSLWIDIGSDDNPANGAPIIAKNSPVLSGDCVVGIIDYVGKHASLVRLISDSGLTPAVRVARNIPNKELARAIDTVLSDGKELLDNSEEQNALTVLLSRISEKIHPAQPAQFLAKGILFGSGEHLWRQSSISLKGIGFTYDCKDHHGPARDLRTGEPIDPENEYPDAEKTALIQTGDLLVTSGMDGLFPEGLKIAKVTTIIPLQEGAYNYELIATPAALDLLDLQYVTVLQPQKFDPDQIPNRLDFIKQLLH